MKMVDGIMVLDDEEKVKERLISELTVLRERVAELEATETECKRLEEKRKKLEQRLYLLDQMAADSAHEINNHLTGVLGFSQRLLKKTTDEEVSRDLGRIHAGAQRAAEVAQELLSFARNRE